MPYSISTLLIRNLQDLFGEKDPARRRAAIDEIYAANCRARGIGQWRASPIGIGPPG